MADRLYLSYWIQGFGAMSMLRHYGKMLSVFPFSRLRRAESAFRIYAIEHVEPPMIEVPVAPPINPEVIVLSAKEFQSPDVCYELETAWDLWTFDEEWKLAPSRVALSCFGPEFANENGQNLRIDFGLDEQFLPGPGGAESVRMVRDNILSLLRLVQDIDAKLRVERRLLWSESGANFAELLQQTLREIAE